MKETGFLVLERGLIVLTSGSETRFLRKSYDLGLSAADKPGCSRAAASLFVPASRRIRRLYLSAFICVYLRWQKYNINI
jgi:hypothetical protein